MTEEYEVHTLAAPYALHALPDDEVGPFELHLVRCPSCRDEVDEIREVAARLGEAEAVPLPPALKRRVLDEIADVRPLPPLVERPGSSATHGGWPRWWPRLTAAAAAALMIVVGVLATLLVDANRAIDERDDLRAQIEQVASAPDMHRVADRSDGAKAVVMASRSADAAVVMPVRMDPPPEGSVYQAWFIHGKDIRSAGVMHSQDGASKPLAAQGLRGATQVGITVEPEGGSEQPTTDPVMLFDLRA